MDGAKRLDTETELLLLEAKILLHSAKVNMERMLSARKMNADLYTPVCFWLMDYEAKMGKR